MVTEVVRRAGYHQVTFSDGETIRVPEAMYYDFRVKKGDEVDRESYLKLLNDHAYAYALDRAARALAVRDATEKEIEKKLLDAGYPAPAVARVMEGLVRYEYVSDERYAARYVAARSGRYGSRRILSDLRARGVSDETARQALEEVSEEDEAETALRQAKKLAARRDLSDRDDRRRLIAALARRGFSFDVAARAVERLSGEETEGWEDE